MTRAMRWLAALALGSLLLGCRERPHQPTLTARSAAAPVASVRGAPAPKPLEPTQPYRFPAAARVVAIGDLHGDLAAAREALRLAGAIDAADKWVGGGLVLVQTGDQLDRGDDERQLLELLDRLVAEARAAGGALHVLIGNHETMNVMGDFRYVTPAGFAAFADVVGEGRTARLALRAQPEARGRAQAFLPGGVYAKRLAQRNTIIVVGRTVFAHGGVLPAHVDYGIGSLNEEVRRWMSGVAPAPPPGIVAEEAPVWTRRYSEGDLSPALCAELASVLARLDADRLVVGHTVQAKGITAACDGRVWRIDVGMSRYYEGRVAVLELAGAAPRVLTAAE